MEEQPETTKSPQIKKSRPVIVVSGFIIFFAAIALVTLLAIHTVKNHQSARVATVLITKNGFQPSTLIVKKGTKITWVNGDSNLHQVASNPFPKDTDLPNLKSEILNNAQAYDYTANTIGTFGYHDQITPTINGTLVIQK